MQKLPEISEELFYHSAGAGPEYHKTYRVRVLKISREVDHRGQHRVAIEFLDGEKPERWVRPESLSRTSKNFVDPRGQTRPNDRQKRRCNLCGREFKARTRFMRFCDVCKGRSEVYRFADM